jgi:hypothetical protein
MNPPEVNKNLMLFSYILLI